MGRGTPSWSYAWCERLARRAAGNFYPAFRLLPGDQRRGMCALYAFCRVSDDLSDEPGEPAVKRAALLGWRHALHAALEGDYSHPLHPALHDTVRRFAVPARHLDEIVDGVCMDLDVVRYPTFAELYRYCYHVASAVGLASIHVWGFRGAAPPAAEAAGIALQLTNILRDVREDAERGRIYLPGEDLTRFGCDGIQFTHGVCDDRFRALMRFQADRAYGYYEQARPLVDLLAPAGKAVFLVLIDTYRALLDAIVRRDFDVLRGRVRVGRWHKVWLAARAVPVRLGLTRA